MSIQVGKNFKCDICGLEMFVKDHAFAGQDPFPEGWVNLRTQLRKSGNYRSASVMGAIEAEELNNADTTTLNLDICGCCWEKQTIDIAALFRKKTEKEYNTLH